MIVWLALTYLLAAVPFGLVLTTLFGGEEDIRAVGSGNIGATNVARVYGWRLAVPVLGLDMAKGFLPVWGARLLWSDASAPFIALVALTAFCGHCFSVFLAFRGGKGVATGAGAAAAAAPLSTLLAVLVWGVVLGVGGRSSLASIAAALTLVAGAAWLQPSALWLMLALALGVIATHVANIRRMVRGEEARVVPSVAWGRRAEGVPADDSLAKGPGGGAAPEAWRSEESISKLPGEDEP